MSSNSSQSSSRAFLGHPIGLFVLFFTEMWERFSFYGMRSIFALFLIAKVKEGGWGWSDHNASLLAGLYGAMVYLMCIPSGAFSDRYIGVRVATMWGAVIQCAGHFLLGMHSKIAFAMGIYLLSIGTGLLKTNISSLVGTLYKSGDARRDVGFSIFYTGINIGAFTAPLVIGGIQKIYGFHTGFTSAGVGMFFSILIFVLGQRYIKNVNEREQVYGGGAWMVVPFTCFMGMAIIYLIGSYGSLGFAHINLIGRFIMLAIVASIVLSMAYIIKYAVKTKEEGDHMKALVFVFIGLFVQCIVFEQAAGFFTVYTERFISRRIWLFSLFGVKEVNTAFFQSLNPIFVVLCGWPLSKLWVMVRSRRGVTIPAIQKISVGVIFLALSCLVLVVGELQRAGGFIVEDGVNKTSAIFIIIVYWIQTVSELCIIPVSLSFVTKVAPPRLKATLMGILWGVISFGYFVAGEIGSQADPEKYGIVSTFSALFVGVFLVGLLLFFFSNKVAKLSYDVESDGAEGAH